MTILGSGNVGIGTTNPTQKLDVNGSVNIDGNLTLGQKIVFALGGFIQNIISGQVDVNGTLNVTGGLNVDNGTLFVNETNNRVGIGTTTPTNPLSIAGTADLTGNLLITDKQWIGTSDASSRIEFNRNLNGNTTGVSPVIGILDANLGVRNPNAVYSLDVAGDIRTGSDILQTTGGTFAGAVNYTTGNGPLTVATGDVDNDGYADVVTANSDSNTVSVLINDRDGTFATQVTYATGTNPHGITAGDFDNDGYADFAVANDGSNTTSVFINSDSTIFIANKTSNRVGIGTASPAVKLHVNESTNATVLRLEDTDGICNQNPEAGSLTTSCSSDKKLKKNIRDAESVLEEFEDINVRDYVVKASGKEHTGVIAQEINKTYPELVHDEEGELFVEQPNPWKLLKAIQELKEMFDSLVGGNYYVGSAEMVIDEDSVGQAIILLNSTSVRVEFSNEYATEPIVTVTPIGLPNFFYGIDNINTTGFDIEISEVQDKEIVFNWHAFAQPKKEVEIVNVTDITEINITNQTGLNETQKIGINQTGKNNANNTGAIIKNRADSQPFPPTEGPNNKSAKESEDNASTKEASKSDKTESLREIKSSKESITDGEEKSIPDVETSVQQEGSQDLIGGSLITGGIIGVNEEQGSEEGIFSRLFRMIFGLINGW